MGKERLLQEMKDHVVHEIYPTLSHNVKGRFQVQVIGMHKGHVELELRLIDKNRNVLQSFGSKIVQAGGTVTLNGAEFTINFMPKRVK